ncbi:MAG: Coenzyme A biosynthesis bifunctional protein CoaBC [Deltaproteobacteria bacterium ADurb.Bin510]|nr:MAG: Coenzyme A biosynthesis bifunctional protein CoaBC [Deltaproteobacteria bacterium ADurb.Bin510]
MNTGMWQHAATQANLELLKQRGALVLEPASGMLACGVEGQGRMPEPEAIAFAAFKALSDQDLKGKRILITCGPTAEDIDPVRFITNRSTGLMGACLAEAATLRGAAVTVISGPVALDYAPGVEVVKVRSAADMLAAVENRLESCDALIMAAAVADYTPAKRSEHKIKKGAMASLELGRTADVLATIKPLKGAKVYVGFAAETQNELANAQDKLERKGLDLIVANTVGQPGTGFAASTNSGALLAPGRAPEHFQGMPKTELADLILDRIKALL